MGFNRRKMEGQRRQAADKEAAARRATDAQVLADRVHATGAWRVAGATSWLTEFGARRNMINIRKRSRADIKRLQPRRQRGPFHHRLLGLAFSGQPFTTP
jgi:hypothetical protein